MRTPLLFAIVATSFLTTLPGSRVFADSPNAPAATADDAQAQKMEKFKAALDQLNLSDDQKSKIQRIMASEPKGRERRQHIMAVLTPEQKEKLKQLVMEHREASGN